MKRKSKKTLVTTLFMFLMSKYVILLLIETHGLLIRSQLGNNPSTQSVDDKPTDNEIHLSVQKPLEGAIRVSDPQHSVTHALRTRDRQHLHKLYEYTHHNVLQRSSPTCKPKHTRLNVISAGLPSE